MPNYRFENIKSPTTLSFPTQAGGGSNSRKRVSSPATTQTSKRRKEKDDEATPKKGGEEMAMATTPRPPPMRKTAMLKMAEKTSLTPQPMEMCSPSPTRRLVKLRIHF